MQIDIITLFPELVQSVLEFGVVSRARQQNSLQLKTWNPRRFTRDRYQTVDDRPYGGGPGMVMKFEPLYAALQAVQQTNRGPVVCLSPQGKRLDQRLLNDWAGLPGLVLVAGRYEGLDERFIDACVDQEVSLGDYVISGGELAAMVIVDALARLLPGVLGNTESAGQDSFMHGLLDYPHYTRPEEIHGHRVPEVLLSGDHARIARWRMQQALGRTWLRRPDLLETLELDAEQQALLEQFKRDHVQRQD